MVPTSVTGLSNHTPDGREISDHFGVAVRLEYAVRSLRALTA